METEILTGECWHCVAVCVFWTDCPAALCPVAFLGGSHLAHCFGQHITEHGAQNRIQGFGSTNYSASGSNASFGGGGGHTARLGSGAAEGLIGSGLAMGQVRSGQKPLALWHRPWYGSGTEVAKGIV